MRHKKKQVLIIFNQTLKMAKLYNGYIDDSRNTDNAWMESTAIHCHLNPEQSTAVTIKAASDADAAMWVEVTEELYNTLFSGQGKLLKLALDDLASILTS